MSARSVQFPEIGMHDRDSELTIAEEDRPHGLLLVFSDGHEPRDIDARQSFADLNRRSEAGDRRAYLERTAAINSLHSLAVNTPGIQPPVLDEFRERDFRSKECREEMLASR